MKKHAIAGAIIAASLMLDIVTKYLVVANLFEHQRINVFGSFVQLILLYNKGGLFGIMQGYQGFFLIVSILVLGLMIAYYVFEKKKNITFCSAMALIISGALGNIIDRVSGKPGVVDFIYIGSDDFYRWPAFNVADAAIVAGAVLLLVFYYFEEKRMKREGGGDQ
jgi:signal peptidase II